MKYAAIVIVPKVIGMEKNNHALNLHIFAL